jgi:hypothetical protein
MLHVEQFLKIKKHCIHKSKYAVNDHTLKKLRSKYTNMYRQTSKVNPVRPGGGGGGGGRAGLLCVFVCLFLFKF